MKTLFLFISVRNYAFIQIYSLLLWQNNASIMKITQKTGLCACCAAVLMLTACGSKNKQAEALVGQGDMEVNDTISGIQRMRTYNYTDSVQHGSHLYVYTIHREASDSLPTVTDESGYVFADNIYQLTILKDGRPFVNRRFAKSDFAHLLSADFRRQGILDGFMCDTSQPGLRFAVSVSYPQSDMYEPFLLSFDEQGGMVMERDTRSDIETADSGEDEGV